MHCSSFLTPTQWYFPQLDQLRTTNLGLILLFPCNKTWSLSCYHTALIWITNSVYFSEDSVLIWVRGSPDSACKSSRVSISRSINNSNSSLFDLLQLLIRPLSTNPVHKLKNKLLTTFRENQNCELTYHSVFTNKLGKRGPHNGPMERTYSSTNQVFALIKSWRQHCCFVDG